VASKLPFSGLLGKVMNNNPKIRCFGQNTPFHLNETM
jgi:hypothetical protein